MFGYDWPRFHALLNDLPVALLAAAVFFDLVAAATKRASFRQVGFWTLMLGALGGAAAVLSGLQAEGSIDHGDAVHRVMETHELMAFITLGIFGVLAVWRIFRENRMGGAERALATILSLGGLGVLVATGFYGGRLMFDHAAGISTEVLRNEAVQRGEGHQHSGGESPGGGTDHEHGSPAPAAADSAGGAPATPPHTQESKAHTDPPGTAPHKH
ncbi:MAG: DUF2231 domain-containing protein [Gemmatimonadales bacterium]